MVLSGMAAAGSRRNRTSARHIVSLALVTALAFLPVLGNGFVDYDDEHYLTKNAMALEGLSPASVGWAFTTGYNANWHPLTWLSHLLDVSIFGLRPAGHHAVSLLLHIVSTIALYALLRGMTGWTFAAWFSAALFAVHPLHVESVAWAAERKDVLSGLFFMLTLLAWTKHVRSARNSLRNPLPTTRWHALSLVFFAMGLLSKPMLVTLPFVLLLLDWWPLDRLAAGSGEPARTTWRRFGPLVLEKAPFLLLTAGSSIVTYLVQQASGAVRDTDIYPFSVRLGNAVTATAAYLGKTVLPVKLSVIYPHLREVPSPGRLAIAAAVLLACSLAALLAGKRRPHLFTGWWWFAGMLIPVIGLVQVGVQAMADRYTYLPLIGIFLALAAECEKLVRRGPRLGGAVPAAAVAVVLVLGVLTFRQATVWRDTVTLFTHAIEVTDNNWAAQLNLGFALNLQGRGEEGRKHLTEARRMSPNIGRTHQQLGVPAPAGERGPIDKARTLAEQGKTADAEAILREELARDSTATEARYRLALLLMRTGRGDEAAVHYRELLRSGAMVSEANDNLGVLESQAGRLENAEILFRRAIEAGPEDFRARTNLGSLLARLERLDEACALFRRALELRPNYLPAMLNLADALRTAGKMGEAATWYRAALGIDQANERARTGLAATGEQP